MIEANIAEKINSMTMLNIIHLKTCKLNTNKTHQGRILKIKTFTFMNLSHLNQFCMNRASTSTTRLPITITR
jgi:hypothetical protein